LRRCRVPRAFSQRPEPPLLGVAATYASSKMADYTKKEKLL
jgi:hypothetical protein